MAGRRRKCGGLWLLVLTLAVLPCVAQISNDVHIQPRPKEQVTAPGADRGKGLKTYTKPFVANVNVVLVPLTVADGWGRLVSGLDRTNFTVFEDGQPQKIEYFYMQDTPISVGIIFDSSGSIGEALNNSRAAVNEFMQASNPKDEFFLITFADKPSLDGDFTDKPEDIQGSLLFTVSKGRTALWDAIYLACAKMKSAKYPKRVLMAVSDGGENHSRYTYNEIRDVVRESDVQIYGVAVPGADYGPWGMADLSSATGGRTFEGGPNTHADILTKIAVELRYQYVLGYKPTNRKHDGKFRRIRVKLLPPRGLPPLKVSLRKSGYYAPEN